MADNPATPFDETLNREAVDVDFGHLHQAFTPDAVFAFDARDDAGALSLMARYGLTADGFIVVIPRYRYTPSENAEVPGRDGVSRDDYNAAYLDADLDKLAEAVTRYVRETGNKALLAPEHVSQLGLNILLFDRLPDDVKPFVEVMGEFWMPDTAASVFTHAQAVLSVENHSPIMAAKAGTPFVMVHQPEDSIKSQMFADIGLADWYVPDIGAATGAEIASRLMSIINDMSAAKAQLAAAMELVGALHAAAFDVIRAALGLAPFDPTPEPFAQPFLDDDGRLILDGAPENFIIVRTGANTYWIDDQRAASTWGGFTVEDVSEVRFGDQTRVLATLTTGGVSMGTDGNDWIAPVWAPTGVNRPDNRDNLLIGGDGFDRLDGGRGGDRMEGGLRSDTYVVDSVRDNVLELAGQGFDTVLSYVSYILPEHVEILRLQGTEDLTATGNAANNRIVGNAGDNILTGGPGKDKLDGGDGIDTAAYDNSPEGVRVDLARSSSQFSGGDAQYDVLTSIENLRGSAFADVLLGNSADNRLEGGAGADFLSGRAGDDWLIGGADGDVLHGSLGQDTAGYEGSDAGVTIDLRIIGVQTSNGDAGGDKLTSIENLAGSDHRDALSGNYLANVLFGAGGNDMLKGFGGEDVLHGGAGDDLLIGGADGDHLFGDEGADRLRGQSGADVLTGGLGQDTLSGDDGADRFVFLSVEDSRLAAPDSITDFERGLDRIDLSQIDANEQTDGVQSFDFIGKGAFSYTPGELRYAAFGGLTRISADTDGDGRADLYIVMEGTGTLTALDLIL